MDHISNNIRRIKFVLGHGLINGFLIIFRFGISKVQQAIIPIASINGFLASLYFTFVSQKFYREHKAVLQGIRAQQRADIALQKTSSQLRRNIHRLEKGLIMQPRRDKFAEDYINITVQLYKRAKEGGTLYAKELEWAGDVLTKYFSVVSDTPKIKPARDIFIKSVENSLTATCLPYLQETVREPQISYPQLVGLFTRRRSVRWYLDKPISRDLISKAIDAASLAPSACNRQPFYFRVLDDKQQAIKVAKMAGGTSGFADNIPCLLVVIGDLGFYKEERDRHLIYIDGALASMQLMLALETLGLSSCPINWPDIEEREQAIQKELGLKIYERPVMQISVGYADPKRHIPYSQKKNTDVLVHQPGSKGS